MVIAQLSRNTASLMHRKAHFNFQNAKGLKPVKKAKKLQ